MLTRSTSYSSDHSQRRIPEEKGPFGKARKRGTSRSKTATPARKEDQAKLENLRAIDDIFARQKITEEKKNESFRARKPSGPSSSLPISASAPSLIEGGPLGASFQGSALANAAVKEPTEVILYGYGSDVQWAAIDFYERVSSGIIYEEYDRQPPTSRYNLSLSQQKESSFRSLSKASVRKINEYIGGEHWIKVTFDSPEAAERACHYSPHVIQGFLVYAERYRGTGPNADAPVRAVAGSRTASQTASPNAPSSTTIPFGTSSTTLSSATATASVPASMPPRMVSEPFFHTSGAFPSDDEDADATIIPQPKQPVQTTSAQPREPGRTTLRIKGAKPAVLLPSDKAFLPAASRWQQTFGSLPIIGWIIGSNHGIIGDQVPRKEDGSFDSASASLYWRTWYAVDSCFGTDFCGVRDAEYDE